MSHDGAVMKTNSIRHMMLDLIKEQTLLVENIRQAVSFPIQYAELHSETGDLGHQVMYALSGWFARLPERGILELPEPRNGWDYVFQGLFMVTGWRWLGQSVKWRTRTYAAHDYLPNIPIPDPYNQKRFQIWWY